MIGWPGSLVYSLLIIDKEHIEYRWLSCFERSVVDVSILISFDLDGPQPRAQQTDFPQTYVTRDNLVTPRSIRTLWKCQFTYPFKEKGNSYKLRVDYLTSLLWTLTFNWLIQLLGHFFTLLILLPWFLLLSFPCVNSVKPPINTTQIIVISWTSTSPIDFTEETFVLPITTFVSIHWYSKETTMSLSSVYPFLNKLPNVCSLRTTGIYPLQTSYSTSTPVVFLLTN